ncbi:MAG: ABC transporter ATP-binding protein/permease, partial [Sphingomonas parapaucimobilis]
MMPPPAHVEETRREAGLQPAQPAGERWAHAWRLSARYFVSQDWKWAWFLVACYCVIEVGTTSAFLLSNKWQREFYDAIEQRQGAQFLSLVVMFMMIAGLAIGTQ